MKTKKQLNAWTREAIRSTNRHSWPSRAVPLSFSSMCLSARAWSSRSGWPRWWSDGSSVGCASTAANSAEKTELPGRALRQPIRQRVELRTLDHVRVRSQNETSTFIRCSCFMDSCLCLADNCPCRGNDTRSWKSIIILLYRKPLSCRVIAGTILGIAGMAITN